MMDRESIHFEQFAVDSDVSSCWTDVEHAAIGDHFGLRFGQRKVIKEVVIMYHHEMALQHMLALEIARKDSDWELVKYEVITSERTDLSPDLQLITSTYVLDPSEVIALRFRVVAVARVTTMIVCNLMVS